jgi:ABC-type uncharacterized transport system ATPase component
VSDTDIIKALLSFIAMLLTGGAFFLLRAVFENSKKRDATGTTATKSMMISDLHRWHSPDDKGRQDWKNPEIRQQLADIRDSIDRQTSTLSSGQRQVSSAIEKMHDTFTGLADDLKKH